MGFFISLKMVATRAHLPRDLAPYSTVFWHYNQWRAEGIMESMRKCLLHGQVHEQVKKKRSGQL